MITRLSLHAKKFVCLIVLAATLIACSDHHLLLPRLKNGDTIVAFGDSLTSGTGTTPDNSYPAVLGKLIGFPVINAGVPGETTEQSIQRLPGVLSQYTPSLVILCIGGNDILHGISNETIAKNLTTLIHMIKDHGASVLLIAVPQKSITLTAPDFYQTVATQNNIPVNMTLMSSLFRNLDDKSDAIHLNTAGYAALAEGIKKSLQDYSAIP